MSTISFAEIIQGRAATVRITADGFLRAIDLVQVMTGKNNDQAGRVLRRLEEKSLYSKSMFTLRGSTRGGHPIKLVRFSDSIELIMVLPGKTAKHIRKKFADIIVRYLDGDRSMCDEIHDNYSAGKVKSYSDFASSVMKKVDIENEKKQREMPPTSYVYATKSPAFPGLIKIGKADDVANRMSTLNTSCSPGLLLLSLLLLCSNPLESGCMFG